MRERDERFIYKVSDLLRGHFKTDKIMKLNIGMTFVKWACQKENLQFHSLESILFGDKELFNEQLRYVENTLEEQYLILRGVLSSFIPSRWSQDLSDLYAFQEAFNLPEWDEYTANELVRLFNNLVMEADGQDEIYSTPESIRSLMVRLIAPRQDMKVVDIFSGVGSCLTTLNDAYKDLNPALFGEEINYDMYAISVMLFIINDISNVKIVQTNVYNVPEADAEMFDNVLMDAPFGRSVSLEKSSVYKYGLPAKSAADWANYQIAMHKLKSTGKAVVTASIGALNRATDLKIREGIVTDDLLEAVIMLPSGLYAHTAIPTALLVFNKQKPENRRNKVFMVDASKHFVRKNKRQNEMPQDVIFHIASLIQNWNQEDGFSTIIDTETLAMNEYNLNVSFYLNAKVIEARLDDSIMLKEVAEILPGVQVTASDLEILKRNATHYFLNVKNIQDDEIIYDDDERIRDKKVNWYGKYDIQAGDIIMTTKGTTLKAVIVPDEFQPAFISNNLTIIRVNQQRYNPYVLLKYLKSEVGRLVLERVTTGAGISVINASKLCNIEIPNYDIETCLRVGERIKANIIDFRQKVEAAKKKFEREERTISQELGF